MKDMGREILSEPDLGLLEALDLLVCETQLWFPW